LTDDGSQAQWFVDGGAAFAAIAAAIENAKSEVYHFSLLGVETDDVLNVIYFQLI
jgi:phosphatidylserine/phosphatidylglycerophosphate/cardiolipin synthase-like enzyme